MNAIHRSLWNDSTQTYVAVSELARAPGGMAGGVVGEVGGAAAHFALTALAALGMLMGATLVQANPVGGVVSAGAASINISTGNNTNGARLTVNQTSQTAAINWQSFNVGAGESVQFVQPNAQAVALNRVVGADPSRIFGSLSANGQVFLINPNGILFGQGAAVNVQGLVASTLGLSDADFMARNYKFAGSSSQGVTNAGSLNADGGYVALLGARVSNTGTITATLGSVALAAGQGVTLDIAGDHLLSVNVDQGVLNALVDNGGLIQADGGQVLLTAQAAGALLHTAVNNTGVVQARTVRAQGGVIKLLGDMQSGTVHVGGTLDASAPAALGGGDGGFVETSASHVGVAPGTVVTTQADSGKSGGKSGRWLIDPIDYMVAPTGGDMSGATLTSSLATGVVLIQSSTGRTATDTATGTGSIHIEDAVTWSANTLTLTAANNIVIGSTARTGSLTATGTAALVLNTATANGADATVTGGTLVITPASTSTGGLNAGAFQGQINLSANTSFKLNGQAYTVITALGTDSSETSVHTLQGMQSQLSWSYVLGADIDATTTSTWASRSDAGFKPIGSYVDSNAAVKPPLPPELDQTKAFTGVFEGLGHAITNLTVKSPAANGTGMFGVTGGQSIGHIGLPPTAAVAQIRDLELRNPTVTGVAAVGALVGFNSGVVNNSFVTGLTGSVGGANSGSGDSTAYAVYIGGLVGENIYTVSNSGASASVTSTNVSVGTATKPQLAGLVGGLVGFNAGDITLSHASGAVTGFQYVGGLVGNNAGSVTSSFATGAVTAGSTGGGSQLGGLVGNNGGVITGTTVVGNSPTYSYATGAVSGSVDIGGLVGLNSGSVALSYASGNASGTTAVGGLVGANQGPDGGVGHQGTTAHVAGGAGLTGSSASVTTSYATGTASGSQSVGGLVGLNASGSGGAGADNCDDCAAGGIGGKGGAALISQSYATGAVSGSTDVGGLVGRNVSGALGLAGKTTSAASGHTTGVAGAAGSLPNAATLTDTYASGAVSGSASNAGGLVGYNGNPTAGATSAASVSTSYANGTVGGGGSAQGLAIGHDAGGVYTNTFYLTQQSSQLAVGTGASAGINGLSAAQFAAVAANPANFTGFSISTATATATASGIWGQTSASGHPFLCALTPGCSIDVRVQVVAVNTGSDASTSTQTSYYGNSVPTFQDLLVTSTGAVFSLPSGVTAVWSATPNLATPTAGTATAAAPALTTAAGGYVVSYKPLSLSFTGGDTAAQALYASYVLSSYGSGLAWTVNRAPVTVTAPTVTDRVYGVGKVATLSVTGVLSAAPNNTISGTGIYASDAANVTLVQAATGTFGNRNVGSAVPVTYLDTLTGSAASNYQLVLPTVTGVITAAPLTVTGTTVVAKTYDGTISVKVSGGKLVGVVPGDNVALVLATTGNFTTTSPGLNCANVGACSTVGVVDSLTGTASGNYLLTSPTLTSAITAAPLMVSGVSVTTRAYDGTLNANLSGTAALVAATGNTISGGIYSGDNGNVALLTAPTTGSFRVADASASAQAVTVSASLTGSAAGNYVLVAPALTGVINPAPLTVSGSVAADKTYDGTLAALLTGGHLQPGANNTIGGTGVYGSDTVTLAQTGTFSSPSANSAAQTVTPTQSLTGTDAHNYVLTPSSTLSAVISPAPLTVTGTTVVAHSYDGSAAATLRGGVLAPASGNTIGANGSNGVFSADLADVSLTTANTGTFASANASASAQGVTALASLTLSNGAVGNYVFVPPTLTGFINRAPLTISGLRATSKVYDGSATAALTGTATLVAATGNTLGGGGILSADASGVQLIASNTGSFASPNASASAQAVTTADTLNLSGSATGNYALVQPAGLSGIIRLAALVVTGSTVANKTFNGNTAATPSGGVLGPGTGNLITTATGVFGGDIVTLVQAGNFTSANASSAAQSVTSADQLSGTSAGNYALTPPTGWTAAITPAPLTVSGTTVATRTYNGLTTASLSGGVLAAASGNLIGANGVLSSDAANVTLVTPSTGQFASPNASASAQSVTAVDHLTLSGAAVGNYVLVQPVLTGFINPAPLTAAGTTVLTHSYDGTNSATVQGGTLVPATGNTIGGGSGVLAADLAGVTFTPALTGNFGSVNASANAQAVTVVDGLTLTGPAFGNYVFVQPSVTGTITPAPLSVSGSTVATRIYDGSNLAHLSGGSLVPATGNTIGGSTGVLASDAANLSLVLAATGTFAGPNASAAAQTVSVLNTLAGTALSNYVLVQPALSGFINPAPLTVTGTSVTARTYDGSNVVNLSGGSLAPAAGNTLGGNGTLSSDAASVSLVLAATGTVATPDASANARSVSASDSLVLTGAATGNYLLIQPTLSGLIGQAPITVIGSSVVDKTFNGNTLASLTGGHFAPVNTGSALTSNHIAGSGVVASDVATLVLSQSGYFASSGASVSALGVSVNDSLSGTAAGNYVLVQPTGLTGALLPAPLTVANVVVAAKTYDGSNAAVVSAGTLAAALGNTIGGSGVLSADVANVVLSTVTSGTFASVNASASAQAVSVANTLVVSGNAAGNYVLVQPALTGTISAAPLTVTGTLIAARTYDSTHIANASGGTLAPGMRNSIATASGVLTADAASVALVQVASFASPNAASAAQAVTASDALVLSGAAAGNYVLVQPTGLSAVISPAPVTVSGAAVLNKTYDGTATATLSGGSLAGVFSVDAGRLGLTQSGVFASANANPAAQAITATDALSGAAANNYLLVQPSGLSAVIAPAPLTIVGASVLTRSYDASSAASLVGASLAPAAGNRLGGNGVLSADAAGVSLLTAGSASFASPNASASAQAVSVNATLALSGSSVGNYLLVQPTGLTGVITPAPLTVVGTSVVNKVFDGTTVATLVGGSLSGVLAGDAANVLLTAAGSFATSNVNASAAAQVVSAHDSLTLSGAATGNYVLVQPANLSATISPATLTVTALANQKTYDGTAGALATPVVSGLVAGSSVSGVTESYQSANVLGAGGSTLAVNGGLVINDGNNGANYTVVTRSATGSITPAALGVIDTLVGNKVYDASTATTVSGGVLVGLFNHDAVTLVQSGAFVSANAGTGVAAATFDSLGGAAAGNYVVTAAVARSGNIAAAPLTISGTVVANKVFDGTNSASLSAGNLVGVLASDLANVSLNQSGYFTRPVPDTNIPVTATATLGGTAAANYVLVMPTGLMANISPDALMPSVAALSVPLVAAGSGRTGGSALAPVAPRVAAAGIPALAGLNISLVERGIRLPLSDVAKDDSQATQP